MTRYIRFYVVALLLLAFPLVLQAQSPAKPGRPGGDGESKHLSADGPVADTHRQIAFALVLSLADEARNFRSEKLRASVQARTADILWEIDKDRARNFFRRAWEAAKAADKEAQQLYEEKLHDAHTAVPPANLRVDVLKLATRRDPALGEEFLAQLDEDKNSTAENAATKNNNPVICPSPVSVAPAALTQRLGLANQLLDANETERALQIAGPALNCITAPAISFLSKLRKYNAPIADQRYQELLMSAGTDAAADANTVSLLSSYVLTPFLFITVDSRGVMSANQYVDQVKNPLTTLPSTLRAAFFSTAAQVLIRPLPSPDQDKSSAGHAGTYFVIARLLPFFEQYTPNLIPQLRAQLQFLTPDAPEAIRNDRNGLLTKGLKGAALDTDESESMDVEGEINHARSSAERDRIYAIAAERAVSKGDPEARELADKIEDEDLRQSVRAFVDVASVRAALSKQDVNETLRIARKGELTPLQRVLAFTGASGLLVKTAPSQAIELLDEALAVTRRMDNTGPDRARALVGIAKAFFKVSRLRSWETMTEVVKAANDASDFIGEGAQVTMEIRVKDSVSVSSSSAPDFDLSGIFGLLAKDDIMRAIEIAKSFNGESPRAISTLAIARAALTDSSKSGPNHL